MGLDFLGNCFRISNPDYAIGGRKLLHGKTLNSVAFRTESGIYSVLDCEKCCRDTTNCNSW